MRTDELSLEQLREKAAGYDPPIDVTGLRSKDAVHQAIVRELAARQHGVALEVAPDPDLDPDRAPAETLEDALLYVLADLGAIPKNGKAPENMGGYMFRRVEDVTAALKPLFARHGVLMMPTVLERVDTQRSTSRGGVLYCTNLKLRFRFMGHGDELDAEMWGEGTDSGDKAVQKAVTSALKTTLSVTFLISDSELDAEAHDVPETTGAAPPGAPAADEAPLERVQSIADRLQKVLDSGLGYPDAWKRDRLPNAKLLADIIAGGEYYLTLEQANACEVVLTEAERYIAGEGTEIDAAAECPECRADLAGGVQHASDCSMAPM